MGSMSLILFDAQYFSFEDLYDILSANELSILRQASNLAVWLDDGPLLFIKLIRGESIRLESTKIGLDTPYAAKLEHCGTRIEITFDDLEEVRTEADTLIEVQALLQEATEGFIFNTWNGKLAPPPDYSQ